MKRLPLVIAFAFIVSLTANLAVRAQCTYSPNTPANFVQINPYTGIDYSVHSSGTKDAPTGFNNPVSADPNNPYYNLGRKVESYKSIVDFDQTNASTENTALFIVANNYVQVFLQSQETKTFQKLSSPPIQITTVQPRDMEVGDVNGDKLPDVVLAEAGKGFIIYLGSIASGQLSYNTTATKPSETGSVAFGASLALSDLDADSVDEIIVGASGGTLNRVVFPGKVFVYKFNGTTISAALQTIVDPRDPKSTDSFGKSVAVADVIATTPDGKKELVVGAPDLDATSKMIDTGAVYVFTGSGTFFSSSTYKRLTSPTPVKSDRFGAKVEATGADGYSEAFVVAATSWGNGIKSRAEVFKGDPSAANYFSAPKYVLAPVSSTTGWASSGINLADVNGDFRQDIMIGAPNAADCSDSVGAAFLYLSHASDGFNEVRFLPPPLAPGVTRDNWNAYGWSIGAIDNLVIVGEPGREYINYNDGQSYVYRYTP